jgi:MOSC domain-containing protein YiiM
VVSEGSVGAGDTVTVLGRPDHGVTIGDVFRLRDTAADRLRRMLDQQHDLATALDHAVRRDLSARAR